MPQLPLEQRINYRFSLITARVATFSVPMYKARYGLTPAAWATMAAIGHYQPISPTEIAGHTATDADKVTRAIDVLVKRHFVHRELDPQDRRRSLLTLTPEGVAVHADVVRFANDVERAIKASLTASQVRSLMKMLDTIDQNVETYLRDKPWEDFVADPPVKEPRRRGSGARNAP
ncbi:MAG: MarR family winged helix-turn-helix transcriptional regulator [Pigmentiphaga sp.]